MMIRQPNYKNFHTEKRDSTPKKYTNRIPKSNYSLPRNLRFLDD